MSSKSPFTSIGKFLSSASSFFTGAAAGIIANTAITQKLRANTDPSRAIQAHHQKLRSAWQALFQAYKITPSHAAYHVVSTAFQSLWTMMDAIESGRYDDQTVRMLASSASVSGQSSLTGYTQGYLSLDDAASALYDAANQLPSDQCQKAQRTIDDIVTQIRQATQASTIDTSAASSRPESAVLAGSSSAR